MKISSDDLFMKRALQLAELGKATAHPNPMVGAVIVHENRIIGEGYHEKFGEAHAEVNAINSVSDKRLLAKSKLYVTLEPCSHYGKTPPCADLIVRSGIPAVFIGVRDPFSKVDGRGIKKLIDAGVKVTEGILEEECRDLNVKFFTAHEKKRPYITLKWAVSSDGYMGRKVENVLTPVSYSTPATSVLVHKLRSEHDAIMTGAGTVLSDDPRLDLRFFPGRNPLKVILDSRGDVPKCANIFKGADVLYFSDIKRNDLLSSAKSITDVDTHDLNGVMRRLYDEGITSVLVEGGATLMNRLIEAGLYDSMREEISPIKLGSDGYGQIELKLF